MSKLYLVRHAEAQPETSDFDRLLTPHGKEEARRMGDYLKTLSIKPDQIMCSPAIRALTTAQLITERLSIPIDTVYANPMLYNANLDTLRFILGTLETKPSVLLVAHNPGISQLASWLVDTPVESLPTCGLCIIELPNNNWQSIEAHRGKMLVYTNPSLIP